MFTLNTLRAKTSSFVATAKAAMPSASSTKIIACVAAGAAVVLVVQAVATAALSDLGHEIMDLV